MASDTQTLRARAIVSERMSIYFSGGKMITELVKCVDCGDGFASVGLFERHMRTTHGPGTLPPAAAELELQVIDDDDDDDDDDDEEENGEIFPHKLEQVAQLIESYRERSEAAIEESRPDELLELLGVLELLESELLRRSVSTCEQTSRVAAMRRMIEFVLRESKAPKP